MCLSRVLLLSDDTCAERACLGWHADLPFRYPVQSAGVLGTSQVCNCPWISLLGLPVADGLNRNIDSVLTFCVLSDHMIAGQVTCSWPWCQRISPCSACPQIISVSIQVAVSTVTEAERLLFRKLPYPGIYRCVARYGYRDRVHMGNKFVIKLLDKASHCWVR